MSCVDEQESTSEDDDDDEDDEGDPEANASRTSATEQLVYDILIGVGGSTCLVDCTS